jgi:hypothetical protein
MIVMSDNTIKLPAKASLYAKMAAIMAELSNVEKDGYNKFHKYNYVSASNIANAIRGLMGKHNLAFFAEVASIQEQDGKYLVEYLYTFACGDTGETHISRWFGEAQNTHSKGGIDDKALAKAATTAQKYFLMRTFNISSEDDPDVDQGSSGADKTKSGKVINMPQERWNDHPEKFIALCRGYELGDEDIVASLQSSVNDFPGTKEEALIRVIAYACAYDVNILQEFAFGFGDDTTHEKYRDMVRVYIGSLDIKHDPITDVEPELSEVFPEPTMTQDAFADDAELVEKHNEGDLGHYGEPPL